MRIKPAPVKVQKAAAEFNQALHNLQSFHGKKGYEERRRLLYSKLKLFRDEERQWKIEQRLLTT